MASSNIKNINNLSNLFADDLFQYYQLGGKMKNLTSKNVYNFLRKTENPYDYDILFDINIEILKKIINELSFVEANHILDKLIKIKISPVDKLYILDKLNLEENKNWSIEEKFSYFSELSKIKYLRSKNMKLNPNYIK